jgi:hypothetical protein
MNESMREIKCPKCDATATEVINAQENIRRGGIAVFATILKKQSYER